MEDEQGSLYPFVRFSREDLARLPADSRISLPEDDMQKIGVDLP